MDCQYLNSWLTGNGEVINLQLFVDLLSSRNFQELKLLRQAYISLYNQDLLLVLGSAIRRNDSFANAVYLRASEPQDRDAEIVRDALSGGSVNLNVLIEIICTRSTSELHSIKQAYRFRYDTNVEKDIALKTDGGYREILLAILKSSHMHGGKVNMSMAMCDAKTLFEAIDSGRTVDWKTILSLVSERNSQQLKSILISYKELYGDEFSKFLKRKICGKFGKELRVVVRGIQYPEKFLAKQLRRALQNRVDTRDALIRVVVTRLEIDIKDINNAFAAKNITGWSLENFIRREFGNVVGSSRNSNANNSNVMVAEFLLTLLKKFC